MLITPNSSLFEFKNEKEMSLWRKVNDGVMGGLSEGNIQWDKSANTMIWSGHVSLENNGGFASIRTIPQNYNAGVFEKVIIRVKGDGKIYKFRMRPSGNFDGIAYSMDFNTVKNEWTEISLLSKEFQPTFRGRIYPEYGTIKTEDLQQVGFLIAGKQEGNFRLEIDWIRYE